MSISAPRDGIQVASRLVPVVNTGMSRPFASSAGLPAASSL